MTRPEAEALVSRYEVNLCVRLTRRADETVVTGGCPADVRLSRRSFAWTRSALALRCLPLAVLAMTSLASGGKTNVPGTESDSHAAAETRLYVGMGTPGIRGGEVDPDPGPAEEPSDGLGDEPDGEDDPAGDE